MTIKHQIIGEDLQAVVIDVAPGETIRAEAGTMMYMTQTIEMDTVANTGQGHGLLGGLMSGLKRVVAGDSFFITTFTAVQGSGQVAFSAPYPGKIIPLDLSQTGDMLCQRDSYLCSAPTIDISIAFTQKFGAGLFGGEGFILQKLTGQGMAFLHACGMIVPIDLQAGQSLRVNAGCLVAMTSDVSYDIQMVKGIKSMLFGGEGLFFANLTGPGRVYLQTLPFSRLADRIIAASHLIPREEHNNTAGLGGMGGGLLAGDLLGGLLGGNEG